MTAKITAQHLERKAIVYVRQSTPAQVKSHTESTKLQYALADRARELGFTRVEAIDDDLGRSGSGAVERAGFNELLGAVCANEVGAVLSIEDARLARNGREWHHLIDLCALTGALVIDAHDVFDPRVAHDRLVLGLKGSMAEFELSLFRQRSFEAIRAKARRGELRIRLAVGLRWNDAGQIEKDPDTRIREAIALAFRKFMELGSLTHALRWFSQEMIALPAMPPGSEEVLWKLPNSHTIHALLTNPFYAGAYAFGRTEVRTTVVDGRARKTGGHRKQQGSWTVLLRDHHEGYISWPEYERNQATLAGNAHVMNRGKIGRGGRALLAGLLRCQRCGRKMSVAYKGATHNVPRYYCDAAHHNHGAGRCISFGGLRVDEAVGELLLRVIDRNAIDAAIDAAEQSAEHDNEQRRASELELKQLRYEARLAERRYQAVDPDNRLVASELEARWNALLLRVAEVERGLADVPSGATPAASSVPRRSLLALADDLSSVWSAPSADPRLKQRIARLAIIEVIANIDGTTDEIVLVVHWAGGRHTELRVTKNKPGHTSRWTDPDAIKVIRRMAGHWSDRNIALTLNRLRLRSGTGLTWTDPRVYAVRHRMGLPADDPTKDDGTAVSLEQATKLLGVSNTVVRRLIRDGILPAIQVSPGAPWQIQRASLDSSEVQQAAKSRRSPVHASRVAGCEELTPKIPGL